MFELWKILKRNPGVYYPRLTGTIILGYFVVSCMKQFTADWKNTQYASFNEPHSGNYREELRQYKRIKNREFINYVLEERKLHQERLKVEAKMEN